MQMHIYINSGPGCERRLVFEGFVNNNGADRPAHLNSLIIHKFVIHLMESITSRFAMYEIYSISSGLYL